MKAKCCECGKLAEVDEYGLCEDCWDYIGVANLQFCGGDE